MTPSKLPDLSDAAPQKTFFPCRADAQAALDAFRMALVTTKGRFRSRVSPVWTHYEDSVFLSVVGHALRTVREAAQLGWVSHETMISQIKAAVEAQREQDAKIAIAHDKTCLCAEEIATAIREGR